MVGWNISMPGTKYFELGRIQNDPLEAHRFQEFVNELSAQKAVALDTETTGLTTWKDLPLYWSTAWAGTRATLHANTLHQVMPIFNDPNKDWVMANAKYDTHILANVGIELKGRLVDTQVQHALLYEDKPHGLKLMAKHLLGWTYGDFQDQFGKIGKLQSATDVIRKAEAENMNLLIEYAANDAWATWGVYEALEKELKAAITYSLFRDAPLCIETLWDLFHKTEVPYTKVLYKMERRGIKVDRAHLERAKPEAELALQQIEREIVRILGYMLNPKSTAQLRNYFFGQCGYAPVRWSKGGKTGTRSPSVDAIALEHYAAEGDTVAKLLLEHRDYSKLLGTYIEGLHALLDPHDRIHTRYNQDTVRCMPAGSLVLTSRGYLPVEAVRKGDSVLTHRGRARTVVETSSHAPAVIYEVTLANGTRLRTSHNHEYYLANNRWVQAKELNPGDTVTVYGDSESWRSLPDWPYEVSSWGRVRSETTKRIVQPQAKNKWGHLKVTLSRNGAQKRGKDRKDFSVHRLVLCSFVGSSTLEVRHLNGIAWDNTLHNLAYGTSKENTEDARRHGTLSGAPKLTAQQVQEIKNAVRRGQPPSSTAKLTYEIALNIRARYALGEGRAELAREFGVSHQAVTNIVKNRTWQRPEQGITAEELADKYKVSAATIREIWSGKTWSVEKITGSYAEFGSSTVVAVTRLEPQPVYGLTVEEDSSHVTGGVVTHNTGRLSSASPNLQNIPRPENDKWNLRSAFIAEDGYEILALDYEQLEMRLLAAAAMEADMISIFERNWDIHMGNASLMFNLPYDDLAHAKKIEKKVKSGELPPEAVTAYIRECLDDRAAAKAIGFGLNYGMGAKKLARTLGCSEQEAQQKIDQYKQTYPAVNAFYEEAIQETEATGYAFTILGRRRNVAQIASHRRDERALGERIALNTPIQGSAADGCKLAQINIDKMRFDEQYDCHMLLQVHDELVFECLKENVEAALHDIGELMSHPFPKDLAVHLAVDGGHGHSWGQAK